MELSRCFARRIWRATGCALANACDDRNLRIPRHIDHRVEERNFLIGGKSSGTLIREVRAGGSAIRRAFEGPGQGLGARRLTGENAFNFELAHVVTDIAEFKSHCPDLTRSDENFRSRKAGVDRGDRIQLVDFFDGGRISRRNCMGFGPSLAFVTGEITNRRIALRGRLGVELVQSHCGSLVWELFFGCELSAFDNDLCLFVGSTRESPPEFGVPV